MPKVTPTKSDHNSSSPEPSLRQALGDLANKPFPRPITKRQSQKFNGGNTPSKGTFTPRSSRFNPTSSRPSTPSKAYSGSPEGRRGGQGSSPVPELDPLEKALAMRAWVGVQLKALSRFTPPNVSLLLLSPSRTSSSSSPYKPKINSKDLATWMALVDACEAKMEKLQVVELPRLMAAAKGPPSKIDLYDVILSVLPLLRTLRTQLLARRHWLELLALSSEWEKTRAELEGGTEVGRGVWGLSQALSTLASLAHKCALVVQSAVELRASLSPEHREVLMVDLPRDRDSVWWALKDGIQRKRDVSTVFALAPPAHSHQATHSSLLFPSTTPSFSSLLTNTISFPSFPSVSTLVPAPSTFSSFSSSLSPFTFPLHRVRCWFGLATAITEADGLTKTDEQIFVWYRVATGAAAKGRERAEGDA